MENDHLLSGLVRKRAQLAAEIAHHQERWRQLASDLINIDATIQIIAPDYEHAGPVSRYVPPPHQAYKGEIARLVAEAFRDNPDRALSTWDVAEHVMKVRALDVSDYRLRQLITKRVGACLAQWRKKGRALSERGPMGRRGGEGGFLAWRLAAHAGFNVDAIDRQKLLGRQVLPTTCSEQY